MSFHKLKLSRLLEKTVWCLCVAHSGRLLWGCCCPSIPREDTVVQPHGATLPTGCPRECPGQPPPGLAQVFAVRLMADLGSGRCLPLVQGGENLDPHPECSHNPKGRRQVSPASSGLGFIIPNFVLEDPLSCKSKRHFYYYFQLLHDSYYSSALTSAINNNRIVNYCSF